LTSEINKEKNAMSHVPHELAEEFPDQTDRIHDLKTSNAHFARLADEYHEINRAIHRAETRVEPISDDAEQDLRRKRLHLKDEIAAMLSEQSA
jgi:uncharacterized protein